MKHWLRKWIASSKMLQEHPSLARVHHSMSHPAFWSFNRHTAAPAVAIGVGIMFLPLPLQMLWAVMLAIYFKANIPIAVSITWLNNPFTFIPLNFFIFTAGNHLLMWIEKSKPSPPPPTWALSPTIDQVFSWLLSLGKPYFVGLIFLVGIGSFLGYVFTACLWRISISIAWKSRRSSSSKKP